MSGSAEVVPGAWVRTREGMVGIVERLERHEGTKVPRPDYMVVRSDDGNWRYHFPLALVASTTQGDFYSIVNLAIGAEDLTRYVAEDISAQTATNQPTPAADRQPPGDPDQKPRIPLAAEQLRAYKEPVELGRVHIHKGVESIEESQTVPIYHEEVIVEHISPDQYGGSPPADPDVLIIPVVEEQLVVEKRTVVREYIRVRKNVVTEQQEIRDTVRREVVTMTERRAEGAASESKPLSREVSPGDTPHDPAGG